MGQPCETVSPSRLRRHFPGPGGPGWEELFREPPELNRDKVPAPPRGRQTLSRVPPRPAAHRAGKLKE